MYIESSTDTYILADDATKEAVIIDPVKEIIEIVAIVKIGLKL